MLGLRCPEGSIVKIFSPPCIKSTRCFRVVVIPSSNCLEYSLQENCLDWIMFILFGLNVICFGNMLPTFVLYTLMCRKYIGRPFTVKNSPWTKRDISLGPCLEKMKPRSCQVLCSKNTLKVHETWFAISCSYVFLIKVTFVYYMCGYGR